MLTAKHGPTVGDTDDTQSGLRHGSLVDKRLRKYSYLTHNQLTIERREKSGDMKGSIQLILTLICCELRSMTWYLLSLNGSSWNHG